jgi:hypothetical protein
MRRYLVETAGRYGRDTFYRPNRQSIALEAFADITNPRPIPECLSILLSGGSPSTLSYDDTDNGGFYDTDTFIQIIEGGVPSTNFC